MVPVLVLWLWVVAHLMGMGTPVFVRGAFSGYLNYKDETIFLFLFLLFGLFWIVALISAIEKFTVASTTCMWYFSGQGSDTNAKDSDVSVSLGIKWAFTYHFGSLALGSFLIALVNFAKLIIEILVKKAEASGGADLSPVAKCVLCCARCCIWALDAYMKFITKNAYIQIALHGNNFCTSAS